MRALYDAEVRGPIVLKVVACEIETTVVCYAHKNIKILSRI
jgi:hypothetical protein